MTDPRHTRLRAEVASTLGLATDLYELTMGQAYLDSGFQEEASFEVSIRTLPPDWGFFVAAGIDAVVETLPDFRFSREALEYLRETGLFSPRFLSYLEAFRFSGSVRSVAEGEVVFPGEPILEVTAPIIEAQLLETLILNTMGLATLSASKASRCVLAARGRDVVDFGFRRTHGVEASIIAARSMYLAGFAGSSNVLAGKLLGIPVVGTMAHSFVSAFDDEEEAFRAFARSFPSGTVLLVDTYDTVEGVRRAARVGRELARKTGALLGIRLDSGDLRALAMAARDILDREGLRSTRILASGNLDEHRIAHLLEGRAPIDAFGVGTRVGVVADAPAVDIVYKLVAYRGTPRWKRSPEKESLPGRKQVFRYADPSGRLRSDQLGLITDSTPPGSRPLLATTVRSGGRVAPAGTLAEVRGRVAEALRQLPEELRKPREPVPVTIDLSPGLAEELTTLLGTVPCGFHSRHAMAMTSEDPTGSKGEHE